MWRPALLLFLRKLRNSQMPCEPITFCSSFLSGRKNRRQSSLDLVVEPICFRKAKHDNVEAKARARARGNKLFARSSSQARREFVQATAGGSEGTVLDYESLPTCEEAHARFREMYPRYMETAVLDELRQQEYAHLQESGLACLDYCGFGLFSHLQQMQQCESASFSLAQISANLCSHALFGAAPEGTMECDARRRIMDFLNIPESEYSIVFTQSRGATFKLVADAYPWGRSGRLVTMYDYESESVGWMEERARERGAKVSKARFRWPSLRVCSKELRKELVRDGRRMQQASKGLFVFPVQSRVSGCKYSYQWMALAQQSKWHVLLDASAMAPKDMDSLAMSLFRPDFIAASFFKLFGGDPSGFGCLFIKNSVARTIQDLSGAPVSGIVRIIPFPTPCRMFSGSSSEEGAAQKDDIPLPSVVSSFSGPMPDFTRSPAQHPSHAFPDDESSPWDESEAASVGGISRSPMFSEGGTDNLFGNDLGPSPLGTASRTSVSEDAFSGPIHRAAVHEEPNPPFSLTCRVTDAHTCVSSRSRIKRACSGFLHLHTGRVVNSVKGTGEVELQKEKSLNTTGSSFSLPNGIDDVSNLVGCRKEGKDQSALEIFDLSWGSQRKEHCKDTVMVVEDDMHHQREEEAYDDRSGPVGGLETINEVDTEVDCYKTQEQDYPGDDTRWNPKVKVPETLLSDKSNERQQACAVTGSIKENALRKETEGLLGRRNSMRDKLSMRENAIRKETEGDFRLLGRRNGDTFSLEELDDSFPYRLKDAGGLADYSFEQGIECRSDDDEFLDQGLFEEEPQLLCKSLDHADLLGLNKTSFRLRYLINWLISSLLRLRHAHNNCSLVRIYGPQVRYDRGAAVAFNLFNNEGKLLHPELVQMLADQTNISLGFGILRNIQFSDECMDVPVHSFLDTKSNKLPNKHPNVPRRVEVVTACLNLLSDFEDAYRMWAFVARFLDPHFVARELGYIHSPGHEVLA